jgi:hypothetical protein
LRQRPQGGHHEPLRRLHLIHRTAGALAVLAGALLAYTAMIPAAFALPAPPKGGAGGALPPAPERTVLVGGMPGWQIALIAVAAAMLAAAAAVLIDRARAARRHLATPTA